MEHEVEVVVRHPGEGRLRWDAVVGVHTIALSLIDASPPVVWRWNPGRPCPAMTRARAGRHLRRVRNAAAATG